MSVECAYTMAISIVFDPSFKIRHGTFVHVNVDGKAAAPP